MSAQGVIVMSGSTAHTCILSAQDSRLPESESDYRQLTGAHEDAMHLNYCEIKSTDSDITYDHDNDVDTPEVPILTNVQDHDYDENLLVPFKGTASFSIIMADLHNQPMPSGTKISFSSDIGSIVSDASDWTNTNHNGGDIFGGTFKAGEEPESGNIFVKIEFPDNGGSISYSILQVEVK